MNAAVRELRKVGATPAVSDVDIDAAANEFGGDKGQLPFGSTRAKGGDKLDYFDDELGEVRRSTERGEYCFGLGVVGMPISSPRISPKNTDSMV